MTMLLVNYDDIIFVGIKEQYFLGEQILKF